MVFATLEDLSQKSIEIVVFNSVYEKTGACWQENNCVIVQGRISTRDGQIKFMCDNAKVLNS
jgi:DNA polymerase III alpha subunit